MRMGLAYLKYRHKAKNRHGIHSPFVYSLNEKVIRTKGARKQWEIEALRYDYLNDTRIIDIVDMGAGSKKGLGNKRMVKDVARHSSSPKHVASLLQRLADFTQAEKMIELGTNLGFTTAYLAASRSATCVKSIEGDPLLSQKACENLSKLGLDAIIYTGSFETQLPEALKEIKKVDLAYIDGHHTKDATIRYLETILPYIHNSSTIAIGDIHWSPGMESAWQEIISRPDITLSIDLFYVGLIFFRKEQSKEHFVISL